MKLISVLHPLSFIVQNFESFKLLTFVSLRSIVVGWCVSEVSILKLEIEKIHSTWKSWLFLWKNKLRYCLHLVDDN